MRRKCWNVVNQKTERSHISSDYWNADEKVEVEEELPKEEESYSSANGSGKQSNRF
jgi:hypothetical protein